jgi:hypothetical protein
MVVTVEGTVTDVRAMQFSKALSPIVCTLDGMLIEESTSQSRNAYLPIEVIPEGIVIEGRASQLSKVPSSIRVTCDGIFIEVSAVQS